MILRSNNQPWYKERWPWILMAGPALVIVAGIITVWLAVISNDGLVSDDYYKQGLAVNQRLQRDISPVVVNLASQEYFKAVDTKALKARVVECVFQEQRAGQYKIISFAAKRARGLMARSAMRAR